MVVAMSSPCLAMSDSINSWITENRGPSSSSLPARLIASSSPISASSALSVIVPSTRVSNSTGTTPLPASIQLTASKGRNTYKYFLRRTAVFPEAARTATPVHCIVRPASGTRNFSLTVGRSGRFLRWRTDEGSHVGHPLF